MGLSSRFVVFLTALAISASSARAQTSQTAATPSSDNIARKTVVVFARAEDLIGSAQSASQGRVGYADFSTRPMSRVGELAEVIPGLMATQHSGEGKANQYFMRGFNLDHGTDFSVSVDGVPVNFRTHVHGQGYLDLNFIIPEVVEYVDYSKGPYYAEVGDFSGAGAAHYKTYDSLDKGIASLTIGQNEFIRLVLANSAQWGAGNLLIAGESQFYNGPWEKAQKLRKYNAFIKYTQGDEANLFHVMATAYHNDWDSTDQIPLRAVQSGMINRLQAIDYTDGGTTSRYSAVADWKRDWGTQITRIGAYGLYYKLNLWSNFSFFENDAVNGDQFEQADERTAFGVKATHEWEGLTPGEDGFTRVGFDLRQDRIRGIGLFNTARRMRLSTVRRDDVNETSYSFFGENETAWTDKLRTTLGLRADVYTFDVKSDLAANSGETSDVLVSPKFSAAYTINPNLELYGNGGLGFHSNDARGTTITIDPASRTPTNPVNPLVRSQGAEAGFRVKALPGLTTTVSAWWLKLDSELLFIGDEGTTSPSDPSRRFGFEIANFFRVNDWLTLDADGTWTQARFVNSLPDMNRIPNAVETTLSLGAAIHSQEGFTGSLRLRHLGPAPLIEDNSVRSHSTTIVNLGLGYEIGAFTFGLDVFNLFNSEDNDITYYGSSQLPGEAVPVDDILFHPVEPRTIRGSVKMRF